MASIKLKGYVLLESMIAMIIVMLCFGLSVMIYNTVVTGSRSKLKMFAEIQMENEAIKSKSENRLLNETIECPGFRLEKELLPYPASENLYQLHFTAITPDGAHLAEYNELIYSP